MVRHVTSEQVLSRKSEAWALLGQSEYKQALFIAKELYAAGFSDAELTYLIGCCELKLEQYPEAIEIFKESLTFSSSQSNQPYVYTAIATAYTALGQTMAAIKSYESAIKIAPNLVESYIGLADIYLKKDEYQQSKEYYSKASRLIPKSGLPMHKLGLIAKQEGEFELALEYFTKAINKDPGIVDYHIDLGEVLILLELYDKAATVYKHALSLSPLNSKALGGRGLSCARIGKYSDAFEIIETVTAEKLIIADVSIAYLTVCKHVGSCEQAIEYAKRCLDVNNLDTKSLMSINAHLALVHDHIGNYDSAWEHINICKKHKVSLGEDDYNPVVQKILIDRLISEFTSASLFSLPATKQRYEISPIFIVGMPRSGTSLVEQILAAHKDVQAGGELPYISSIIDELPVLIDSDKQWPACVRDLSFDDVDHIATKYIKNIEKIAKGGKYLTDKMPHNFYALGLIQILLPRAKIIHCRRQPLDTCISIYLQNFQQGHRYSENLFNLGAHYFQYQQLMQHWRENLSIDMLELDYEDMVKEPEKMIAKLLTHCDLEWDENCLHFNKQKRKVETASFDQVRQPIYTRSVNRWKNYEKYLDDLKSGLERGF